MCDINILDCGLYLVRWENVKVLMIKNVKISMIKNVKVSMIKNVKVSMIKNVKVSVIKNVKVLMIRTCYSWLVLNLFSDAKSLLYVLLNLSQNMLSKSISMNYYNFKSY